MRRSTSEPTAPESCLARPALPPVCLIRNSQRHRQSYTVSPAGQPLKRSHPAVGAAQAVGRHLDASQRGMIAVELADFDHGGDRSKSPNGGLKISEVAQALDVEERTVKRARAPTWRQPKITVAACDREMVRPSAPAGKTGFSADARQAGTVTTGRAPCDAAGACLV